MEQFRDSSSDDIPYLPPEQYKNYESQHRNSQANVNTESNNPSNRNGRSYFTEEELRELDSSSPSTIPDNENESEVNVSSIPRPVSSESEFIHQSSPGVSDPHEVGNGHSNEEEHIPPPRNMELQHRQSQPPSSGNVPSGELEQPRYKISWGRRTIGLLFIAIPAVLFSVAVHFLDWSMSDFQLFSASFFIFQGIFWPFFGILLADLFCTPRKHVSKNRESVHKSDKSAALSQRTTIQKWTLAILIFVHGNLSAAALMFQILSIQRLNISISLALSFGFDVVVILIKFILENRRCSWELLILSAISYCGYGIAAIPAFTSDDHNTRHDIAIGVGASIGVMLLSIPSSFLLAHLRKNQVRESVIGTTFSFFGCLHTLVVKEIMGSTFNLYLEGHSIGWVIGLISLVFLGTIFLHLEERLSGLIWERDLDDKPKNFSGITRTRIAVFILSCIWELARQSFSVSAPIFYDILAGFLVMICFLLAGGYQAWHNSNRFYLNNAETEHNYTNQSSSSSAERPQQFCAFIPWLFSQKHPRRVSTSS